MEDVPLAEAQVIWDSKGDLDPPVKVIPIMRGKDDRRYSASWGACNAEFNETDDAGRLAQLFGQFVELTATGRISPAAVNKAFLVIPEYRQMLLDSPARYHALEYLGEN